MRTLRTAGFAGVKIQRMVLRDLYTSVEYDRAASERVQQGIDRWAMR